MIEFACPACNKSYRVSDDLSGKRTKCRACGEEIRVPKAAEVVIEPEQERLPWARWLANCQERFGEAPREFDAKTAKYIRLKDGWIFSLLFIFPLSKLLRNSRQRSIFRDGQVVWGHIIQANGALWSPVNSDPNRESDDAPGELVFSNDDSGRVTPEYLAPIAEEIGMLRHERQDDPQLNKIGRYLAAETVRAFGWDVPKRISPRIPCFISTTFFLRKHLPGGHLQQPFLPIVISHEPPYYAMPLPEKFWPTEFREWWCGDEE